MSARSRFNAMLDQVIEMCREAKETSSVRIDHISPLDDLITDIEVRFEALLVQVEAVSKEEIRV